MLTLRYGVPAAQQSAFRNQVCGLRFRADELNRTIAPFQADVLRALGMEHMTPTIATQHVRKVVQAATFGYTLRIAATISSVSRLLNFGSISTPPNRFRISKVRGQALAP
jgi:hypothetical protein